MITKNELQEVLNKAKDICLSNNMLEYENSILAIFFIKYLTDLYEYKIDCLKTQFDNNEQKLNYALGRMKFIVEEDFSFTTLYNNRQSEDIGKIVSATIISIYERALNNFINLYGVFKVSSFDNVAKTIISFDKKTLQLLIELFNSIDLKGKEEVDFYGFAFKYLNGWKFSDLSFRKYIGV